MIPIIRSSGTGKTAMVVEIKSVAERVRNNVLSIFIMVRTMAPPQNISLACGSLLNVYSCIFYILTWVAVIEILSPLSVSWTVSDTLLRLCSGLLRKAVTMNTTHFYIFLSYHIVISEQVPHHFHVCIFRI